MLGKAQHKRPFPFIAPAKSVSSCGTHPHTHTHILSLCVCILFESIVKFTFSAFWPAVSAGVECAACSQLGRKPINFRLFRWGPSHTHTRTPAHSHPHTHPRLSWLAISGSSHTRNVIKKKKHLFTFHSPLAHISKLADQIKSQFKPLSVKQRGHFI